MPILIPLIVIVILGLLVLLVAAIGLVVALVIAGWLLYFLGKGLAALTDFVEERMVLPAFQFSKRVIQDFFTEQKRRREIRRAEAEKKLLAFKEGSVMRPYAWKRED